MEKNQHVLHLAILLSGGGRTLDNLHKRIEQGELAARIELVIASRKNAPGLEKAKNYGYPAFYAGDSAATNEILSAYRVDLVVLAGYLQHYTPPQALKRAALNIHPSLIPAFSGQGFYGRRVHEAVWARGCTVSGCTVHFINEKYDEGPIVLQRTVDLEPEDTPTDIAARVFRAECECYPAAISLVAQKGVDYFWKRKAI